MKLPFESMLIDGMAIVHIYETYMWHHRLHFKVNILRLVRMTIDFCAPNCCVLSDDAFEKPSSNTWMVYIGCVPNRYVFLDFLSEKTISNTFDTDTQTALGQYALQQYVLEFFVWLKMTSCTNDIPMFFWFLSHGNLSHGTSWPARCRIFPCILYNLEPHSLSW